MIVAILNHDFCKLCLEIWCDITTQFEYDHVANKYSITILLETYLSRYTRYQEKPGLILRF